MCVGKATRGDIDPSRWTVDQRTFVWAAPSTPADVKAKAPESPPWTALRDGPLPAACLPYARYASASASSGGEAESSSPGLRLVLQSKVWEPEPNGGHTPAATTGSVFRSPPSFQASSMDISPSNPRMPDVQKLSEVPCPKDVWKSARCKEESSERSSSWVEGLIEEDHIQNAAALKRQLSSDSTYSAKTSGLFHHKASHSTGPGASEKGKRAIPFKDVSLTVSESLSDSGDEGGVQIVSEKRRKRMLSNRASAQRSRQRRQERLDTLEVLVAELRVENTTLVRKAKYSAAAAKKFEDENKILRKRVRKQEALPLPDANNGDASDKIEISGVDPRHTHETSHDGFPQESLGSSKSDHADEPLKQSMLDVNQRWNNDSKGSFDVEFPSDLMKEDVKADNARGLCSMFRPTPGKNATPQSAPYFGLRQAKIMSLVQQSSFQELEDPFSLDLEHRSQDSRCVEDIWLSGCWQTA